MSAHNDNHCQTQNVTQEWKRLSHLGAGIFSRLASRFQGTDFCFFFRVIGNDIDANLKTVQLFFHSVTHNEVEIIGNKLVCIFYGLEEFCPFLSI